LSFAAGATPSAPFVANENAFDMNSEMVDDGNSWPVERGSVTQWRHGDFKDVAFRYTYKLYDDMVTW